MATRRAWEALAPSYRRRLERSGITPEAYSSGVSLRAARGHATTPERPQRAFRNPDLYSQYLRRRVERNKEVPPGILPPPRAGGRGRTGDDSGKPDITDDIGWPGRDTIDKITFARTPNGAKNGVDGFMTVTRYNPDGTIAEVKQYGYNQRDFYTLVDLARQRGFATNVTSLTESDMFNIIA